jgi:hypothetical protein
MMRQTRRHNSRNPSHEPNTTSTLRHLSII